MSAERDVAVSQGVQSGSVLGCRLSIAGQAFEGVCVRRSGVAVYRRDRTYLRIGPGLAAELDLHKTMLAHGFPVAAVLDEGVHDGLTYFIEESLGAETLGDRFEAEQDAGGGITGDGFADFLDVIERQTQAQLNLPRRSAGSEFERLIGVHKTAKRLPELAERIVDAFHIAVRRLAGFPSTLVHSDLQAFNMCAGGVIDLEGAGWGIAGYDVLTAAYVSDLCELAGRRWFATQQIEAHIALVDSVFASHGLAPPSTRLDEFLLCRTIALCSNEHPRPEIRRCRDNALRTMLARFEAGLALLPPADG